MAGTYAWADLAVCRAGALTLAELTACRIGRDPRTVSLTLLTIIKPEMPKCWSQTGAAELMQERDLDIHDLWHNV